MTLIQEKNVTAKLIIAATNLEVTHEKLMQEMQEVIHNFMKDLVEKIKFNNIVHLNGRILTETD